MQAPKKYFVTDVQEDISTRRLTLVVKSSANIYWQFTQSGQPCDLSAITHVYFVYSDDVQSVTITGVVDSVSNGMVKIPLTPSNTAIAGEFDFDICLISGGITTVTAYGRLVMIGDVDDLNESSSSSSSD
jgi:hypothetical protein